MPSLASTAPVHRAYPNSLGHRDLPQVEYVEGVAVLIDHDDGTDVTRFHVEFGQGLDERHQFEFLSRRRAPAG